MITDYRSNSSFDVIFLSQGIHILNKVAPRVAMWLRGEGDLKVATFSALPTTIHDYFALPASIDPISCATGELGYTDGRIYPPHSGTANDSGLKNLKDL